MKIKREVVDVLEREMKKNMDILQKDFWKCSIQESLVIAKSFLNGMHMPKPKRIGRIQN